MKSKDSHLCHSGYTIFGGLLHYLRSAYCVPRVITVRGWASGEADTF